MMIRTHSKPTSPTGGMSRRGFLRVTGGTAAGLVVGFGLPATTNTTASAATAEAASFSPFVRIAPDGMVTVIVKHLDKGQGSYSALATLVAEELEADWLKVSAEFAPADASRYNNLFWGAHPGYWWLHQRGEQLRAVSHCRRRRAGDAGLGSSSPVGCAG